MKRILGAGRAQNPVTANVQMTATIEGRLKGDELKVETIQVHESKRRDSYAHQ